MFKEEVLHEGKRCPDKYALETHLANLSREKLSKSIKQNQGHADTLESMQRRVNVMLSKFEDITELNLEKLTKSEKSFIVGLLTLRDYIQIKVDLLKSNTQSNLLASSLGKERVSALSVGTFFSLEIKVEAPKFLTRNNLSFEESIRTLNQRLEHLEYVEQDTNQRTGK